MSVRFGYCPTFQLKTFKSEAVVDALEFMFKHLNSYQLSHVNYAKKSGLNSKAFDLVNLCVVIILLTCLLHHYYLVCSNIIVKVKSDFLNRLPVLVNWKRIFFIANSYPASPPIPPPLVFF